jgi:hypothetical protein
MTGPLTEAVIAAGWNLPFSPAHRSRINFALAVFVERLEVIAGV